MKKFFILALIFSFLLSSLPAEALSLQDLRIELDFLKKEISLLKSKVTGQVLGATNQTYSYGMTSAGIIPFQQALINRGYLASGNATGNFFSLTLQAVQNFQKVNGLTVTGTLNSQTQNALLTSSVLGGGQCDSIDDFWKYDASSNNWEQQANFGGGNRESAVGFTIGYKGYIGTGVDEFGIKKDFWEWDGDTGVWTQKADFGGGDRQQAIGFSIGNLGYVGTGYINSSYSGGTSDFWEYNPATNIWTQKADFGGGIRARAVGFSISHKGYIGTGDQNGTLMKDFWEWDQSTNTWTQKADFGGIARIEAIGFPIGSGGYVGTGSDYENLTIGNVPNNLYKDFWEYNPITNTWNQRADYGGDVVARAVGFSALGDEIGYVGTGLGVSGLRQDFWEYNPITNTWTQKQDYSVGKIDNAVGFSIRNYGYIGTGTQCDLCTPNTWTQKANYSGGALSYAAGFSIGNKGYIGTGFGNTGNSKIFWEWDQSTNTWTQKADFGGNGRIRATGFSIGNKGYIGTGTLDGSNGVGDFWEYNPITNTWTQKADFGGLPRFGAVGFSINNSGYITTGRVGGNIYLRDLWEYNPATNIWTQKADFGGSARFGAVGFAMSGNGYVGTGLPNDTFGSPVKDFWTYDPISNSWKQRANFGGVARHEATGFSIGDKGYIGIGQGDAGILQDFWVYDPIVDLWTIRANHGGGQKSNGVGFSIIDKGYIGTGFPGGNTYWEYCPG